MRLAIGSKLETDYCLERIKDFLRFRKIDVDGISPNSSFDELVENYLDANFKPKTQEHFLLYEFCWIRKRLIDDSDDKICPSKECVDNMIFGSEMHSLVHGEYDRRYGG